MAQVSELAILMMFSEFNMPIRSISSLENLRCFKYIELERISFLVLSSRIFTIGIRGGSDCDMFGESIMFSEFFEIFHRGDQKSFFSIF